VIQRTAKQTSKIVTLSPTVTGQEGAAWLRKTYSLQPESTAAGLQVAQLEPVCSRRKPIADIAMYTQGEATGALAQRLRLSIFESTAALLPFTVFNGTLADLTSRTSYDAGLGRWTGHGDGKDHTVTYEVMWSLPKDADPPDDEPKLGLVFEARGRMS
jgi:hypothetical protein